MNYIDTPDAAELNAQNLMCSWGYLDAVAGTGGADGGIDVRSTRALAQVKWKGGVTGRPDCQKLVGARGTGTEQLFFFSASGYSAQAIEYADQVGMALFTYDPVGAAEAVNPAARRVLESVGQQVVPPPTDWKLVAVLTAVLIVLLSVTILLWWP
ncbi:restriction endonuclease [Dietzia maris]|uniref:restriction endonuclease n=1 Tax=Dietzia maris TaxID=37915 RepID=UPI0037C97590